MSVCLAKDAGAQRLIVGDAALAARDEAAAAAALAPPARDWREGISRELLALASLPLAAAAAAAERLLPAAAAELSARLSARALTDARRCAPAAPPRPPAAAGDETHRVWLVLRSWLAQDAACDEEDEEIGERLAIRGACVVGRECGGASEASPRSERVVGRAKRAPEASAASVSEVATGNYLLPLGYSRVSEVARGN